MRGFGHTLRGIPSSSPAFGYASPSVAAILAREARVDVKLRSEEARIRVGVSSCLLGERVRFDGGHKRDPFLADRLGPHVEWVPVCPEVEVGMGVPRPTLRLQKVGGELRVLEIESGRDHTRAMERCARRRVSALRRLDLCGYVLKRGSPSCGMERVKVYSDKGRPRQDGRGLYAAVLLRALP